MSVIFGIKEPGEVIIAGDKRATSVNDKVKSDDMNKLTIVNECVCFASAGNASIERAIQIDIERAGNASSMRTDDVLRIICGFYKNIIEKKCDTILAFPFCCIIAGKKQSGEATLIAGAREKNGFVAKEVPMALYPPADVSMDGCSRIFVKNYKLFKGEFAERTIKEISDASIYVSPSGDKWIYNINTGIGNLFSF